MNQKLLSEASKPSPFARSKQPLTPTDIQLANAKSDLDQYLQLDISNDMNIQEEQQPDLSTLIQERTGLQQSEADKLLSLMRKYDHFATTTNPDEDEISNQEVPLRVEQTSRDLAYIEQLERNQEERQRRMAQIKKKLGQSESSMMMAAAQQEDEETVVPAAGAAGGQSFFNDELSQILIQEDPQLLEDIINLLPQEDTEERNRIIDMVNKILNGEPSQSIQAEQQINSNAFSVHNRLYAYAQARQQGLIGRVDAPSTSKRPGEQYYFNPNLMINNVKGNKLSEHQNLSYARKTNPGHQLYQQFLDKQERMKAMQESQLFYQAQERVKSKVNIKSHQLAYRKLEKDLAMAVMSVDRDQLNSLDVNQIGELFSIIGIFKYTFNKNEKVKPPSKTKNLFQITSFQVKLEERKMREDEFLFQFWIKVNPLNEERVDSHIVLEFLKLIYDPYINMTNEIYARKQEELIEQYVQAIKNFYNCSDLNAYLQVNEEHPNWSVPDLMRALRYLTDNFSGFKSGITGSGIKIPSERQLRVQYEISKELTHHPQINQKSEMLEKRHYAKFFDKLHQDILTQVESNRDENLDSNQRSLAGRIVSQSAAGGFISQGDRPRSSKESDNLKTQLQQIKKDPSKLKVPTISRIEVLLEKEELKKRKLREQQIIQESLALSECTFHPQINKPNYNQELDYFLEDGQQKSVSAHERLWELSKMKKVNIQRSGLDQDIDEMQECTFQPQINRESKREAQVDQPQYIKGYEETVLRLKKAKEQHDNKKALLDNMGRAKNHFSGHPTIAKPFQLQTEHQRQLLLKNSQVGPPLIDVEITIATGKVVHLTIREGDDMRKVTKNFCKTYALNDATRRKLEQHIEEYIQSKLNVSPMLDEQYLQQNMLGSQATNGYEDRREQSFNEHQQQQPEYQEYEDPYQNQIEFQLLKTEYRQ